MAFMPWNDDLVLGIAKIDEQHRSLADLVNALHDALGQPSPDTKAVGNILEDLVDATMNHSIAEEELFKRHGYPQIDARLEMNNQLTGKIVQILDQFQANASAVGANTTAQLKDWLAKHIQVDDKSCVAFLKSKGE
jgi:hemerythrin